MAFILPQASLLLRGLIIVSERWHWTAWGTASVVAHAIVLVVVLLAVPSGVTLSGSPVVMSVQLVSIQPVRAESRQDSHPSASGQPKAISRQVKKVELHGLVAPDRASTQGAPHRLRRRFAEAKPVMPAMPTPAAAHAIEPSPTGKASATNRDMDLVRQHLERFKFYPDSARRRGIGGNVDVQFRLIHGGQAVQVSIVASSGYALLDHTAEDIVDRAIPFPVNSGRYRVRLRFWP